VDDNAKVDQEIALRQAAALVNEWGPDICTAALATIQALGGGE